MTAAEYNDLKLPTRSKMKSGIKQNEKDHGKMGPFATTREKRVCQEIRKRLVVRQSDDDRLYLQIPAITS